MVLKESKILRQSSKTFWTIVVLSWQQKTIFIMPLRLRLMFAMTNSGIINQFTWLHLIIEIILPEHLPDRIIIEVKSYVSLNQQ